jgi:hypothetical protein
MRWHRFSFRGCDSLDLATIWPCAAQLAGTAIPDPSLGCSVEEPPHKKVRQDGIR